MIKEQFAQHVPPAALALLTTVALAHAAGNPPSAEAHTQSAAPPESNAAESFTDAVRDRAARLSQSGCTVTRLVHNNITIGVVGVEHCAVKTAAEAPIAGTNGRSYLVRPGGPDMVRTGRNATKAVAVIDRWILPRATDTSHDLVIGVAKGHTTAEARRAFMRNSISTTSLQRGDKLVAAAYPEDKRHSSYPPRQTFDLTVSRKGTEQVNGKSKVHMLFATMPRSKENGEICDNGASGAVPAVVRGGRLKVVRAALSWFERRQTKGKSQVAAECGFADQLPKATEVVKVVRSEAEIPGYKTVERQETEARASFHDPQIPKTAVKGNLILQDAGNSPDTPIGTGVVITNPIFFHPSRIAANALTFIATADADSPDHLSFQILQDRVLTTAIVQGRNTGEAPSLVTTNGGLAYAPDNSGQTGGSFNDASGEQFAVWSSGAPDSTQPSYQVQYHKGNFGLIPQSPHIDDVVRTRL